VGLLASLDKVTVIRDNRTLLQVDNLAIARGERWVFLGPNGSGKSTLLTVLAGRLWPTSGTISLLGHQLGSVDLRSLRPRLGLMSSSVAKQLRRSLPAHDIVLTGIDGALEPWWRSYDQAEHDRADAALAEIGAAGLSGKDFGVLSDGERAHVLLARVLMSDPDLLCLDEPASGLDLGARERLMKRLELVSQGNRPDGLVLVTHHLEEIPLGITHAGLVSQGKIVASGPLEENITSSSISETFGISLEVSRHEDGRFSARSAR